MPVKQAITIAVVSWTMFLVQIHANAADVTATWVGGTASTPNSWAQPDNWNPSGVPNNNESTYDVVINSGTVDSDVSGGVTISSLILNGGFLGGTESITASNLTLDGGFLGGSKNVTVLESGSWNSQKISDIGGVTVDTNAAFDIFGNASKSLDDETSLTIRRTSLGHRSQR